MSSSLVITIAAIGGIAWLGFILVAALRRRGPEEIPSNLAPGTTDDQMETRRLEGGQKAAVLLSAFLAVSLPLYYLGEQDRQVGFDVQFDEESVARGEDLVAEYGCWDCHGPEGIGAAAEGFVEQRSGIAVSWDAPSLNDVLYRYDESEVNFWVTYGRGNTPMPAWGLPGGGPMNEQQVEDVVNYIATLQIPQMEAVAEFEAGIRQNQANRLENADATVENALMNQREVLVGIESASDRVDVITDLAERAGTLMDTPAQGIDTDGDGIADAVETELVALGEELVEYLRVLDPVTLDPESPQSVEGTDDMATAEAVVDALEQEVDSAAHPALAPAAEAAAEALETGIIDPDLGISQAALDTIAEIAEGVDAVSPPEGDLDLASATEYVVSLEEAAQAEDASEELTTAASDARAALDGGQDPDEDGLSSAAEATISEQVSTANSHPFVPAEAVVASLDPTNEATTGEPDLTHANNIVAGYESLSISTNVTVDNFDAIQSNAAEGVAFLEQALEDARWEVDIEGVAEAAFDGDTELAERAVLLFNGYCARCHTAGFAAGVPYTLEAGSGGFGPALWDGRPTVQFGEPADEIDDDLLVQFIINGSEAETPYGLNGFGSGRMPAFGLVLSEDDIVLLSQYLRGGDLTGRGDGEVGP